MAERAPRITVLAVTWRRTQFLRRALESALRQTLDPAQFEIVLSKGVPDAAIEAFCREHGIACLFEETWDLGRRIELALPQCHGEVIVPLEDDDEFDPTKLAIIAQEFAEHPELVYFHNGFVAIGVDGNPLPVTRFRTRAQQRLAVSGSIYSPTGDPAARLAQLEPFDPSWNTSSVAFRRSLLDGRAEVLGRLAFLADRWIYLCALIDRKGIRIDARPLTRYRLHGANTSGVGGAGGSSREKVRALAERIRSISDRQIADFELLRQVLREQAQPGLAEPIEDRLPLLWYLSAIRAPEPSRKNILRRTLELLQGGGRAASASPWAGRWASTLVLLALTPLFVASPHWGAAAYFRLRELPRP
jgi:hypothetical protein